MADSRRSNRTDSTGNVVILETAAQCFMEQGFSTTSIDDVARRMGSTKGRIYHYYSSKTDLFFDVHREGMERLFKAVEPVMTLNGSGLYRLEEMLTAHALAMMNNVAFEAVVVQGVHMHKLAATTPDQRRTLNELISIRRRFEDLFKQVIREGIEDGSIRHVDVSIAAKAVLGAINWLSIWYQPRSVDTDADRIALAKEIVGIQIKGLHS
ncbi:TetR/AcrR family transcriptional regulator [Ochrobactrum soli]|uniref:TetR/AcrR family transcriptional regulator n=2 Tax=Ochrobactrum TaxID=528 RepID=A0ABY2Y1K4_9HYPH|nr:MULTISPECIES: TetR/AcrR family transcriptional regulator [Brucella]RRD22986.1 TetR/AcrR family transcriptional regulator [Brucellaceae bacterium VT-16-1752]WHT44800.1 TetR/AcrR family transcriptional regulator [Ochrobactrum sp. SSR]MDX4072718.1 TetR/AcrR family transcriptional regulator [Brucella sp. NBRC 113783]RLL72099.1 TetR/AcrR family transcriptional regulator [[Ochrobactrum] soli]TNV12301.1 TetR/AcrR family transcriptional regulator [[Ochrobactrum] teleogrylli]